MLRLLKCEFKKFKNTYINSLSFLGMLFPIFLVTLMFAVKRSDWIKSGSYNWDIFNQNLSLLFTLLVGPIITSFIAVFAVYYEYQQKTIKNVLTSPNGRTSIIISKMIYVSFFIIIQYATVAILNILCALILGFDITTSKLVEYSLRLIFAGFSTIMLVPIMMFITLKFRSFIPAMVITVAGSISNVFAINWDKSYLSPWTIPVDISVLATQKISGISLYQPLTTLGIYFIVFMFCSVLYFKLSDQNE